VAVRLSRRRKIAYALVACVVALAGGVSAILALDVYVHHRVQYEAGVNIWGYRGDPVGRKKPGETRIIVLGGSTAFGYGLPWNQSWPYYLEEKIARASHAGGPVSVVNLGIPTDTAQTFVSTLDSYAYLDADIAMFYEGYNDLGTTVNPPKNTTNPAVSHYLAWRYQSPVFRWTGYFPILPLVLNEKAQLMLKGHIIGTGTDSAPVTFRPDLATRATAGAMKSAADLTVAIERRLGTLTGVHAPRSGVVEAGCGRWRDYCGAIEAAVQHALARGQIAVVITQPYVSDLHIDQQETMAAMMARKFGDNPRVRYVNLGRVVDMTDHSINYDGLHLVARGNERLADALLPVALELVERVRTH
jgi:lysophospholipase L1-like esterase